MIVSDHYRTLYLSIPRTASTSVRMMLKEHYGFRNVGRAHEIAIDDERQRTYTAYTTVRNPFSRAYSLYRYMESTKTIGGPRSFLQFLEQARGNSGLGTINRTSQTAWLKMFRSCFARVVVMVFEDFPDCLDALPFRIDQAKVPWLKKTEPRDLTADERALVAEIWKDDVRRWPLLG